LPPNAPAAHAQAIQAVPSVPTSGEEQDDIEEFVHIGTDSVHYADKRARNPSCSCQTQSLKRSSVCFRVWAGVCLCLRLCLCECLCLRLHLRLSLSLSLHLDSCWSLCLCARMLAPASANTQACMSVGARHNTWVGTDLKTPSIVKSLPILVGYF